MNRKRTEDSSSTLRARGARPDRVRWPGLLAIGLSTLGAVLTQAATRPASGPASTRPGTSLADIERLTTQLQASPAAALPGARSLFAQWCESTPDNVSLGAFRQRLEAVTELHETMSNCLRRAGQQAVGAIAANVLGAPGPDTRAAAAAPSEIIPAEQLYRSYLPYFTHRIDVANLTEVEQAFLKTYYNAEIDRAIREVFSLGRALAATATENHDLEYYLLLLPLLHNPSAFDRELLKELPSWILSHDRLTQLSDFCLFRAGRVDAAEAIASIVGEARAHYSGHDFLLDAAARCESANRPDLAVACLRAAIRRLKPDDRRVVELRFGICETWARGKNLALAASEAGQFARDLGQADDVGKALYLRIKYLSDQRDTNAVLYEVDDAMAAPGCGPYLAELMYIKWLALRKEGKGREAGTVLKDFLARFPRDTHAPDMYYAVAVDCLSAQRYDDARRVLESMVQTFPDTSAAARSKQLLQNLDKLSATQTPGTDLPATRPGP